MTEMWLIRNVHCQLCKRNIHSIKSTLTPKLLHNTFFAILHLLLECPRNAIYLRYFTSLAVKKKSLPSHRKFLKHEYFFGYYIKTHRLLVSKQCFQ